MARRPPTDQPLRPSVLDRLLDDEPHSQVEAAKNSTQVLRALRQSVRRDLENLLNTRWRVVQWPPDLEEMDSSLVNYGIPDFTAADLNAAEDPDILLKSIELAIRNFEPRLRQVRLEQLDKGNRTDRTFRFRIDAVLSVEPVEDPVRYDSSLEPASGMFHVEGGVR